MGTLGGEPLRGLRTCTFPYLLQALRACFALPSRDAALPAKVGRLRTRLDLHSFDHAGERRLYPRG
jgi:hypothetical protein